MGLSVFWVIIKQHRVTSSKSYQPQFRVVACFLSQDVKPAFSPHEQLKMMMIMMMNAGITWADKRCKMWRYRICFSSKWSEPAPPPPPAPPLPPWLLSMGDLACKLHSHSLYSNGNTSNHHNIAIYGEDHDEKGLLIRLGSRSPSPPGSNSTLLTFLVSW